MPPVLVGIVGFVGLVELTYSASIGRGQGRALTLFNHAIDTGSFLPWVATGDAACLRRGGCCKSAAGVFGCLGSGKRGDQSQGTRPMNAVPAIALRDIHKTFGATKIIRGVTLRSSAVNVTESSGRTALEKPHYSI